MSNKKKTRVGIRIDMTPMVDVAFLLLTFFMLTTQFRAPDETAVELPGSHSDIKEPESQLMTITIQKDGKVFFGVDSQSIMGELLGETNKYRANVEVAPKELGDLIVRARIANPRLRTILRGDREAPYGKVEDVMNILQKTKVTRFNMLTELEQS